MKDDSFVIILQGDVLFDFDKSVVKPEADKQLTQAAAMIQSARRVASVILINRHTDNVGKDDYNMALSQRRARAVADWFISRKYLPRGAIKTQGFGKTQPVQSNNDAAGRAKNRRVEI
jgi:OOP family OmpA-OmpF porin